MSEFPKEDFQLDLALVEETLQEYLRTGDIHSDNVALLFPTTPRVYKGGIHTEENTYKAFKAFIDHPVLGKSLILASQKLLERTKKSKSETPKDVWEVVQDSASFFDIVHEEDDSPFRLILKKFFGGRPSYYDLDRVFSGIPEGSYSQRRFAEVMKPHFLAEDKRDLLSKVEYHERHFQDIPQEYLEDPKYYRQLLLTNPSILDYAGDEVFSDKELMLAAIKGSMKESYNSYKPGHRYRAKQIFAMCSSDLRSDKDFIRGLMELETRDSTRWPCYTEAIKNSTADIREDVEFALEYLTKFNRHVASQHFPHFSLNVRKHPKVAEMASLAGKFTSLPWEYRSNSMYARHAITVNPINIAFCAENLWVDGDVLATFRSAVVSRQNALDVLKELDDGRAIYPNLYASAMVDSYMEDFEFQVDNLLRGEQEPFELLQAGQARAVATEFLARGGEKKMVEHLFPEGLEFVEGMRAARALRQKKFDELLAELKSTDWLELYKSEETQESVPEESPQKIAGLGLESSAQKFFGVDEAGVIHLEEWVMDANSVAEINRFESFEGTVTETEIAVSDSADHSGSYLFRQTVSEVEGAPSSQFALEIGEGSNALEVSGARAIELFGLLLVSRNPQLEAGFNLLGFSFSQGGTWDWLCEWFTMSFCDLKFKSGRPPELRREERLDEYDDLDGDGDEIIYYHTTTHDDNGEVFGIVMCSSGNQPLGLAFLTNDWEDTVYSLY
jgi:hypothetical protein